MEKVKKEYMNNSKIASVISRNAGLVDAGNLEVDTLCNPKNGAVAIVNLRQNANIQLSDTDINPYDMAVMDAIYTLCRHGYWKLHRTVVKILTAFRDSGYIAGFGVCKTGKMVEGVEIQFLTAERPQCKSQETAEKR